MYAIPLPVHVDPLRNHARRGSDLEYADDTVLIAGIASIACDLLKEAQDEASRCGLLLNEDKTKRIAMDSDELVRCRCSREVPRVAIIHEACYPGPEIRARIAKAMALCTALRPLLTAGAVGPGLMVMLINQCVLSSLVYGLHTLVYHRAWEARIDATQARCLRGALRVRTACGSRFIGEEPTTYARILRRAKAKPLSARIAGRRFQLLGHVLRMGGGAPARAVSFDRFGFPKELRSTRKSGDQRLKWCKTVLEGAAEGLASEGLVGVTRSRGHRYSQTLERALDRQVWRGWIKQHGLRNTIWGTPDTDAFSTVTPTRLVRQGWASLKPTR